MARLVSESPGATQRQNALVFDARSGRLESVLEDVGEERLSALLLRVSEQLARSGGFDEHGVVRARPVGPPRCSTSAFGCLLTSRGAYVTFAEAVMCASRLNSLDTMAVSRRWRTACCVELPSGARTSKPATTPRPNSHICRDIHPADVRVVSSGHPSGF